MLIYRITNTVNGKVYIGQTKNAAAKRLRDHLAAAKRGENSPLCSAIRKYGADQFEFTVLIEGLDALNVDNAEILEIAKHKAYIRDEGSNGYNQTRGGKGWSSDVCRDHSKDRKRDGYSASAKKRANRLVAEGKHNFQGKRGSENARMLNAKLVAEGKHPSSKLRKCSNCGKEGKGPNMFRYHFANCSVMEKL